MGQLRERYRQLMEEGPSTAAGHLLFHLLRPLSWLYGMVVAGRGLCYRLGVLRTYRSSVPVVSIGNLTVGGTGKTPAVDYVVRSLQHRGCKVAVVSRGYGGTVKQGVGVVSTGQGPLLGPEVCGDEPYLLARRNPEAVVLIARQRAEGVRLAVEHYDASVVVLDDGFQHLAVRRDFDIVLLDDRRPLGNGHVLPAGTLREFPSALRRGDLFILTRADQEERPEGLSLPGPVLRCRHRFADTVIPLQGEPVPLDLLRGRKAVAFAGIARPQAFFDQLRGLGVDLLSVLEFPDHAPYGEPELRRVAEASRGAELLITTEKDGVKLRADFFNVPCYQVPVALDFFSPGALEKHLEPLCR